jgi:hypothetical protein
MQRCNDDDLLLLASDGLWDVFSNQDAVNLALRSMQRARERGASRMAACRVACTVLTKAAVDRGSRDNVTVRAACLPRAPPGEPRPPARLGLHPPARLAPRPPARRSTAHTNRLTAAAAAAAAAAACRW